MVFLEPVLLDFSSCIHCSKVNHIDWGGKQVVAILDHNATKGRTVVKSMSVVKEGRSSRAQIVHVSSTHTGPFFPGWVLELDHSK